MIPAQDTLRSRRPRKPLHTYSLTVDGDSHHLTAIASRPSYGTATITSAPLPVPQPQERDILSYWPATPSSSRLYVPFVPVPHGPRSTNLYLYPPTDEDRAKAQKRRVANAEANEDARKEREDDERRRNVMLGIPVPRKSTRKGKAKGKAASGLLESAVALGDPAMANVRRSCRTSIDATKATVELEADAGQPSTSTSVSSTPHSFMSPSVEDTSPFPTKKQWQKRQAKVNSRPTPRLTTRSQSKAKATSIAGDSETGSSTIAPSDAGDDETMDVDVENQDEAAPQTSTATHSALQIPHESAIVTIAAAPLKSLPNSRASSRGLRHGPSPLSQVTLFEDDPKDSATRWSSSSSDTFCDDAEGTTRNVKKELMTDGMPVDLVTAENDLFKHPDTLSISLQSSPASTSTPLLLEDRATPPASKIVTSPPPTVAPPTTKRKGGKRKLDELKADSKTPLQTQSRRSGRILQRRKLQ